MSIQKITTIEIEVAIATLFDVRKHIIVPNISWGFTSHEMDIALITKSGFLKEIEIKISKSDFMKDFNKNCSSGKYNLNWDGKNDNGMKVNSGEYFYILRTDNQQISKKIILLK